VLRSGSSRHPAILADSGNEAVVGPSQPAGVVSQPETGLRIRVAFRTLGVIAVALSCGREPQVAAAPSAKPAGAASSAEAREAIQEVLNSGRHPWLTWPEVTGGLADLKALYAAEPGGLFWFTGEKPHPALEPALEAIAQCDEVGLVPADYDAAKLSQKWSAMKTAGATTSPADRALFDIAVTVSAARLLQAVHWGRVDPRNVGFDYDVTTERLDLAAELRSARDGAGLPAALDAAEPQFPVYQRMVKALAKYRALAAAEPPAVPGLPAGRTKIAPGASWSGVPALAARLRAFGDLPTGAPAPKTAADGTPVYEGALVDAVKLFQRRHNLEPDGVIGPGTIQVLNVPASARVRQFELALERERWLPEMRKQPLLFVNVALFRLWAYDPNRPDEPLRMNIVAGKSLRTETPVFVDEMEYVVFRPYWNPPPSILRSEILPKARRVPSYLDRQNMEIVASGSDDAPSLAVTPENLDKVAAGKLFVRQKPSEKNSLGLAKFIFPNSQNIYMHGTPAQALFARSRRDFSHGCIRLEDPARLAEWVLRADPQWTRERIEAAMNGARPTQVNLPSKLKVIIFYDTAYVDSKGVVYFVDDYYGHDATLEKALAGGYPYPRKS
jgi:murein L,D-transpeptidase YcbB/YkuD